VLGGGATGCRPPLGKPPFPRPLTVRCSATASWGAGATTWLAPIFSEAIRPVVDLVTSGGGSITDASGPDIPRVRAAVISGGGAMTADVRALRTTRLYALSSSGAGATTCVSRGEIGRASCRERG